MSVGRYDELSVSVYLKDGLVLLHSDLVATDAACCCTGACCITTDPFCVDTTSVHCTELGGTFQGLGTSCPSVCCGHPGVTHMDISTEFSGALTSGCNNCDSPSWDCTDTASGACTIGSDCSHGQNYGPVSSAACLTCPHRSLSSIAFSAAVVLQSDGMHLSITGSALCQENIVCGSGLHTNCVVGTGSLSFTFPVTCYAGPGTYVLSHTFTSFPTQPCNCGPIGPQPVTGSATITVTITLT